jgi:hypothetical protein
MVATENSNGESFLGNAKNRRFKSKAEFKKRFPVSREDSTETNSRQKRESPKDIPCNDRVERDCGAHSHGFCSVTF